MRIRRQIFSTLLALASSAPALAQSVAFTYQGRLSNAGSPAAGFHDFRFALFDAVTSGNQVGATQCADDVNVTDGDYYELKVQQTSGGALDVVGGAALTTFIAQKLV